MSIQKMCTFGYHYSKEPHSILSTFLRPVTLLSRTFLIGDLGLWATPNGDCFQMWKFDPLVPVVLSHQPAHPHRYSERRNRRELPEKLAQVLQSHTPAYPTCHLQAVHLETSNFTSTVSISSPVKCDNDKTHKDSCGLNMSIHLCA